MPFRPRAPPAGSHSTEEDLESSLRLGALPSPPLTCAGVLGSTSDLEPCTYHLSPLTCAEVLRLASDLKLTQPAQALLLPQVSQLAWDKIRQCSVSEDLEVTCPMPAGQTTWCCTRESAQPCHFLGQKASRLRDPASSIQTWLSLLCKLWSKWSLCPQSQKPVSISGAKGPHMPGQLWSSGPTHLS